MTQLLSFKTILEDDSLKILQNLSEGQTNIFRSFSEHFRSLLKISEVNRRFLLKAGFDCVWIIH